MDNKTNRKSKKELRKIFNEIDCDEAVQESIRRIKEFAYHELKILKRRCPGNTWPQEKFNLIFNEVWFNDPELF